MMDQGFRTEDKLSDFISCIADLSVCVLRVRSIILINWLQLSIRELGAHRTERLFSRDSVDFIIMVIRW